MVRRMITPKSGTRSRRRSGRPRPSLRVLPERVCVYERNIESDSQEEMATLIDRLYCKNANDMANQILMNTLAHSTKEASDDMSVLVAGIWNKV